eukprot:TRINITY_DN9445_c0_g1_i3.p1 TRINITY_DN9445_c0_g1~~TRINITY_DN9445_c0_g1_i3.p1  ORF type:complete len:358 (+),score=31.02 TRINITY_DN9445_c0_g1_i3:426-1499(+)
MAFVIDCDSELDGETSQKVADAALHTDTEAYHPTPSKALPLRLAGESYEEESPRAIRSAFCSPPHTEPGDSQAENCAVSELQRRIAGLVLQHGGLKITKPTRVKSLGLALAEAAASTESPTGLTHKLEGLSLAADDGFIGFIWNDCADPDEVICEGHSVKLRRSDFLTLRPPTWLNDEVVNLYFSLLQDRSTRPGFPPIHVFNSFFILKLTARGYDYSAVRRWTKKADIFSRRLLLIPVHKPGHWVLVVVNLELGCIAYYDSLGGCDSSLLQVVQRYLLDEHRDKQPTSRSEAPHLILKQPKNLPQQTSSDCGVFACKFAEVITRDSSKVPSFTFGPQDMPYFRKRMVLELFHRFVP